MGDKEKTFDGPVSELFQRSEKNPVLKPAAWPYPANSVFNPAATVIDGETLVLVRVEERSGISHLTAARSRDGVDGFIVDSSPTLLPETEKYPEELWGVEDPRIIRLDERDEYAVLYTSYSRNGPLVSLATTKDFRQFTKFGSILPPENKDAGLFPRRIDGKWLMIHRPVTTFPLGIHMWISSSDDLLHWGDHKFLMAARRGAYWDAGKIGLGPPPMETPEGWLIMYHGVKETPAGCLYRLGLALLDLENPMKIVRRSDPWVMTPTAPYERNGDVGYVIFPCGWVEINGEIRLYYGAADTSVCLATASLADVLSFVNNSPQQ